MKKTNLHYVTGLFMLLCCFASTAEAQSKYCGTYEAMEAVFAKDPSAKIKYEADQKAFQKRYDAIIEKQKNNPSLRTNSTQTTYSVPIVVHVLLPDPNVVTEAQIASQLTVLNQAYTGTNASISNVPAAFLPVTAHGSIQFCTAQRDPLGNSTTAIIRVASSSVFGSGGAHPSTVSPAWNTEKYLNIWVCNMGGTGLAGYSYVPGSFTPGDQRIGFVNDYRCFGTTGTAGQSPYGGSIYGKTAVHEIGHYFNLQHTWGPNNCVGTQSCSDDDGVADTPPEFTCNTSSPTPGFVLTDQCTTTAPGVMWMNYMDYSGDQSTYMFSVGQDTRMVTALTTHPERTGLITNNNACVPVGINYDAYVSSILNPVGGGIICTNSTIPVVTIFNGGAVTLTSATITVRLDGGTPTTFNWTGSLTPLGNVNVTLPAITGISNGTHNLTICTSLPNGQTDQFTTNDCKTISFTVPSASTAAPLPVNEGFENSTFPSTGWEIINADGSNTWLRTTGVKKTGTASAYINNYSYPSGTGQLDYLRSPMVNFPTATYSQAFVSFDYSYRENPSKTDTLEVVVSSDCGASWASVWKKGGADLATVTPSSTSGFFPNNVSQWTASPIVVDISAYRNLNLYIAIRNKSNEGQFLYIDNLSIYGNATTPVVLSSFTGTSIGGVINKLNWVTASEINVQSFSLERSKDAVNFTEIASVLAKGNSSVSSNYSFSDDKVALGQTNYYRLKMIDKDGKFAYSNIVLLKTNKDFTNTVTIYPNPVKATLFVKAQADMPRKVQLSITDVQGRKLNTQTFNIHAGENLLNVNVATMAKGLYILTFEGLEERKVIWFNKQ